ncbi:MAG: OmpA family protein, partial [Litoreibacter sp.]|nr:OmpA family protein [Litoreibacter sp.]
PGPFVVTGGSVNVTLTYGGATLSGSMKIRFPNGGSGFEAAVFEPETGATAFLLVFANESAYTDTFNAGGSANGGSVRDGLNALVDTTAPSVSIDSAPATVTTTAPFNVTVEFSEDVINFISADVTVGNGSVTGFTAVDGNTYTVQITPDGGGDVTLDVAAAVAEDAAGNDNTAASQVVVGYTLDIEEDLRKILEDDLAATMTQLTQRMEGYASSALQRLKSQDHISCVSRLNDVLDHQKIQFDPDKATLKAESAPALNELMTTLDTCPGGRFEVAGHTDSSGNENYNLWLSEARANAVIEALADRGVDAKAFVSKGYGESKPIASNATPDGRKDNRRVEFHLIDTPAHDPASCVSANSAKRRMDLSANETGLSFEQTSQRERYSCATDSWRIVESTASHFDSENGMSQSMFNLSARRERFVDADSVKGYFVGVYGSKNDVSGLAIGDIRGLGFHGGIYGADRLGEGLYLDYYLGAAAGRHDFDLDFDRSGDTVNADGNYTYLAGFVGAALSGKTEFDTYTLSPRVGIDLSYSPGGDVDLTTSRNALSQQSDLELGSVNGGRLFGELGFEIPTEDENGTVRIAPRISCYQSIGSLNGACSIGGSIDLASRSDAGDFIYNVRLDGEAGSDFNAGSLSVSYSKSLWGGSLSGDVTISNTGSIGFVQQLKLNF